MSADVTSLSCPCGSHKLFSDCCEPVITHQSATTALQLMRSRYSAHVKNNEKYLIDSWHPSTCPEKIDTETQATRWLQLKIISAETDMVHFVAYFSEGNKTFALKEKSRFTLEHDHWYYLDAIENSVIDVSKNMPCPCESGKKYKRCCGQSGKP